MEGSGFARLSERQKDCLRLVGEGYTSKEIGRRLQISDRTVDNHIFAAVEALQSNGRADAARRLLRHEGAKQELPKQSLDLAQPPKEPPLEAVASVQIRTRFSFIPPLGGRENTLDVEGKSYAILRVAVLGVGSILILSLAAAMLLWFTIP